MGWTEIGSTGYDVHDLHAREAPSIRDRVGESLAVTLNALAVRQMRLIIKLDYFQLTGFVPV